MNLESLLIEALSKDADSQIKESMIYSLSGKSKHLRSKLIEAMIKDYNGDITLVKNSAIALEMIQTYSLIHDDLPAMDNDDTRRGQPSSHMKYNEATAILTGDALLTKAFEVIVTSDYNDQQKVAIIKELTYASGVSGMILGQYFDMNPSLLNSNNDILRMYTLKTGMLFGAAFAIGAILSNVGDSIDNYRSIGQALGVAFQVQDDLLEVEMSELQLGKSRSDEANKKKTFVSTKGKEEATYICTNAFNDVFESLHALHDHGEVVSLIKTIQKRGY